MIVRAEEIYCRLSTLLILKSGERVSVKDVEFWEMDCEGCRRGLSERRECIFARQSGLCFECATGNALDFCRVVMCRTVIRERLEETQRCCMKVAPNSSEFRLVWRRDGVEVHWSFDPVESFIRMGYDMLRIGKDLSASGIDTALTRTMRMGLRASAESSRPTALASR
jgi:hypothetical protein